MAGVRAEVKAAAVTAEVAKTACAKAAATPAAAARAESGAAAGVAVMLAFELRWLDVVQDVVPGSRYATISRLGGGATCGETCVMLS